jgi:hypothetical protein
LGALFKSLGNRDWFSGEERFKGTKDEPKNSEEEDAYAYDNCKMYHKNK